MQSNTAEEAQHLTEWVKDNAAPTRIDAVLEERGERYGAFADHASISQELKSVMRRAEGWGRLSDAQKESLEMIAHKIARALNGDPDYIDSWTDIAGYSQLVVRILEGRGV